MDKEKLKEDIIILYEKLERDKELYKEFLKDEDFFLKKRGFNPIEVKEMIKDLMKNRLDILKGVLEEQDKKIR